MDDTISRQAAIDAANDWLLDCFKVQKQDRSCGLIRRLEDLPSAQPEIVRCKDCKYQDKGEHGGESWNLCGYRPWLYVPVTDDHYCGWAKRKEAET